MNPNKPAWFARSIPRDWQDDSRIQVDGDEGPGLTPLKLLGALLVSLFMWVGIVALWVAWP